MAKKAHRTIRLKDYTPYPYLIDKVDLDVQLDPAATRVTAKLKMKPNPDAKLAGGPVVLDGHGLTLSEVKIGGRKLGADDYTLTAEHLTIHKVPDRAFTLETTSTCNPEANKALTGLYRSRGIYCTQCEAEGFRRITYYPDRPDVMSIFTTRIEADAADVPVLLSNGNLIDSGKLPGKRHFATWNDPFRKPAYLFALVGGKLGHIKDTFKTASGRKVDLRIYVEPGKEDRCAWAMDSLKRSMRWDEKRFGREYDLDIFMIVAVSDFNMGAMENKGLNVFNDKLVLASAETATDGNYEAIEAVIAHEYFHNWTGNRITCRDWFQLCLKEGLTVFRDQEFTADERSRTVERIGSVRGLRAAQFPEDAGPLAHPVRPESYIEINNFYTSTVYEKGAEVCRMLQTLLGVDGFRKGMDLYFERHDGEATTVEKFIACFEDACKVDLTQFMLWYRQSGTPELVCTLDYDAKKQQAALTIEQVLAPTPGQPKKKPFHMPVRMGLLGGNGDELDLMLANGSSVDGGILELKKAKQTFTFKNITSRPVASLLRDFSAPVNLSFAQSTDDLEFLMVHDSDLYNRWQAGQTYATRLILDLMNKKKGGGAGPKDLARAIGMTIRDENLEPAYRAMMMVLPGESDIAREVRTNVDPAAIHAARQAVRREIGMTLREDVEKLYGKHALKGPYKPDATSAGHRSIRLAALGLMTVEERPADVAKLAAHYSAATNMTDQMAALSFLADVDGPERLKALAAFEKQWGGDSLVMDKWFATQAMSDRPETVEDVEKLQKHKLFQLTNPNKVRALIGAFAHGNQLNFNRPDGAGYHLVAGVAIELNKHNPQVAARLMGSFRSWQTLEPKRKKLAKAALERVQGSKDLSRDVFEIVAKTLQVQD
jgi:aminopeptidase N